MRISDWSSDVCSSDLTRHSHFVGSTSSNWKQGQLYPDEDEGVQGVKSSPLDSAPLKRRREPFPASPTNRRSLRSEEHTSELQSIMRISYAVFCLKKTNKKCKRSTTHSTQNNIQEKTKLINQQYK